MSAWSIPPVVMASITFYVGLYHLSIYLRRKHHREDLTFALMCLAASLYCVFCAGLYSATSDTEGARWQRGQFIALPAFISAFLWFAFDYTHQKPNIVAYGVWAYYLVAILVQAIDRTGLTWVADGASIKHIPLPFGPVVTYNEATLGPFSQIQGFVGLLAGAQIVWIGVRYYRSGHAREARWLLWALALMYLAAIHETAVSNGIYPFIYVLEYAYLGMILLMASSLSSTVVEAAMTRDALQKSEERLQLAMEAASDGLFDWNMQTQEVYFSPRYFTMLGYEPDELPPSDATWVNLLHPDDKEYALETVKEYAQGKRQSHEMETRLRTKSGGWRWILSRGKMVGQGGSGPTRMVGTHTDTTERKQVEEALRDSQNNLQSLFNTLADFLFILDTSGHIIHANPIASERLKYSTEELLGKDVLDLHPSERRVEVAATIADMLAGKINACTIPLVTKGGTLIPVDTKVSRGTWGGQDALFGISRDISALTEAQNALRESETLFRTLVENSPAGIFLVDDSYRFVYANSELGRIVGYRPDEIINMDFRDFLEGESQKVVSDRYVRRQHGENIPSGYEIEVIHKDGTKKQVELMVAVVRDAQGVRSIAQMVDITGRRQAEAALRESREMLRVVLDSIPVRVFWKDSESVYLGCNRPFASDAGVVSPDDIIGKNDYSLSWAKHADLYRSYDRLVMESGTPQMGYEQPQSVSGGPLRWLKANKVPMRDAQGNVVGVLGTYEDITESKRQARLLQESEDRLLKAQAIAHVGSWEIDLGTQTMWGSDEAVRIYGLDPSQHVLPVDVVQNYVLPEYRQQLRENVRELVEGKQGYTLDYQIRRPNDGEIRYLHSTAERVVDETGEVVKITGVIQDITETKKAEAALQKSSDLLAAVIDAAPTPIIGLDLDGKVDTVWNRAAEKMLGWSAQEAMGQYLPSVPAENAEELERLRERIRIGKTLDGVEVLRQKRDGTPIVYSIYASALHDAEGEISGNVTVLVDVTERNRSAKALKESQAVLQATLESMRDGLLVVAKDGTISHHNSRFCEMWAIPEHLMAAQNDETLIHYVLPQLTEPEQFRARIAQAYQTSDMSEDMLHLTDGRIFERMSYPLIQEGEKTGQVWIFRDITENKQAEAALRESEFFLRKSQTVGRIGSYNLDLRDGKIIVSSMTEDILGIDDSFPRNVEGWLSLVHPEQQEGMRQYLNQHVVAEHNRFEREYRIIRPDNQQERWVYDLGELEFDDQGNPIRMIGILQDITERKQAEETLRESEDRLVKAQALAHVGNWEIDLGSQTMWGSDEALRIYGVDQPTHVLPLEVVQGCALPEHRAALDEAMRDLITGKGKYAEEFQIKRINDGEVRYVQSTAERVLGEAGKPVKIAGVVQDITERKQMELDLQMFQFSIDQASDAIFWFKRDSGLSYVNEQACRSLGYTREELMQLHLDDFDPIYSKERWDVEWEEMQVNRRGGGVHEETLNRRKDGSVFPVEVTSRHLWFGERELHVAVLRDITERKRAQQALEASESRFRALVENSPDFIAFVDKETRIVYVNRVDPQMTQAQANGVNVLDYTVPEYRATLEDEITQVWRTGQPGQCEIQIYRGDRSKCWMNIRVVPIFEAGKIANVMVVLTDTTERRQAEEALRDSQNRLSVIFNQSADLQAVSSVEPDGNFRFIAVNKRYVEASKQHNIDISEEALTGKTLKEVLSDVFRFDEAVFDYTLRYYRQVVDTGQPVRYEEALDTPTGRFDSEVVLAPIFDSTNNCRYILYSSRDITERKKADAEIRRLNDELELRVIERTYQLEVTNRELESFAYSVSHDLRAPLRGIDGFSQALLEDYSQVLDQEGQEHLRRVRAASQRMGQLIDDLLMLSRIARQEMRREVVDLSKTAHEIVAELSQAEPERSVGISIAEGMTVSGDPNLLRIALSNLLANAWKFTGKCAQATIRFYEAVHEGERVFSIEDNGAGFDMKYADKLFGAFQRLHQKSEYEGTGIGLATVQRIIHRHGGRIWAEAEVDKGAAFHFTVSVS